MTKTEEAYKGAYRDEKEEHEPEVKLEDILNSIRGMIEDHQLELSDSHDYDDQGALGVSEYKREKKNSDHKENFRDEGNRNQGNYDKLHLDKSHQDNGYHDKDYLSKSHYGSNENHLADSSASESEILELNDEAVPEVSKSYSDEARQGGVSNDSANEILSNHTRLKSADMFSEFAQKAEKAVANRSSDELETVVHRLMRPMLRQWLDNNLPDIVENVVRDEIRKLVPNK